MRKVHETRLEKAKPKLGQLLKGLKGGLLQRMETRKRILDLYEYDDEEKEAIKKEREIELKKFMENGDEKEKNKAFIDLKCRVKKALADLD